MNQTRVRRKVRILAARIAGMTHRSPDLALRGADLLAPVARRFRRVPSAEELREILPHISPAGARAIRSQMLRVFVRGEFLAAWLQRRGRAAARGILSSDVPPALPPAPLIAATFHIGPVHALGAALEPLPSPLLALLNNNDDDADAFGSEQTRAARFYEAATWLRKGGVVLMALDPQNATRIRVPFFGGTLGLARGAFALSRRTGAPIIPVVARWRGTRVDVVVGEPLRGGSGPDLEQALAAAAAGWLEAYLRDHPEEISLRVLDLMES